MTCVDCKHFEMEPCDDDMDVEPDQAQPGWGYCYLNPPSVSVLVLENDGKSTVQSVSSRPEVGENDRACGGFSLRL